MSKEEVKEKEQKKGERERFTVDVPEELWNRIKLHPDFEYMGKSTFVCLALDFYLTRSKTSGF